VSAPVPALATSRRDAAWSRACGVCRRAYGTVQWNELPAVATLSPDHVQPHLSVPAAWTVELRRCVCGAMLATRLRPSPNAEPAG
jgi:hypothetical protein